MIKPHYRSTQNFFTLLVVFAICISFGNAFAQQNGLSKRMIRQRIQNAIEIQNRNLDQLMGISGVVATATGIQSDGSPVIKVFTAQSGTTGIPSTVEDLPVKVKKAGIFYALATTDRFPRPVPIGVSTGHPDITAGTIGARVTDGSNIFALSNNHVFANSNNARIGDNILQPGAYDGGSAPNDVIGTLYAYKDIEYCRIYWGDYYSCPQTNTMDAAIADIMDPGTSEPMVDFSTPSDGYGAPGTSLHQAYGEPFVINDSDEDLSNLLGQSVQKYGRTTGLTFGIVDAINATVDVCYDEDCTLIGRFEDQIIITPGSFSAGGDSGSLIVTDDENKNPVGLLYAGSDTDTIANRIDLVLVEFGVKIDEESEEPGPGPGPEPETQCVTANNLEHIESGRAYGCGFQWRGQYFQACAVGSDDNLGWAMSRYVVTTSLQETSPDYWEMVPSCP